MFARYATKAMFLSLTAAATLVNVAAAAPAQAADLDARSRTVSYADLDLTSAAGAATLHRRIDRAAHAVCDTPGRRGLDMMAAEKGCRDTAVASAEPQVRLVLALRERGEAYADAGTISVTAN